MLINAGWYESLLNRLDERPHLRPAPSCEPKLAYGNVAGVDEAKDEVREIVDFLRSPERYGRLGGRMPKGVLLVGPSESGS